MTDEVLTLNVANTPSVNKANYSSTASGPPSLAREGSKTAEGGEGLLILVRILRGTVFSLSFSSDPRRDPSLRRYPSLSSSSEAKDLEGNRHSSRMTPDGGVASEETREKHLARYVTFGDVIFKPFSERKVAFSKENDGRSLR